MVNDELEPNFDGGVLTVPAAIPRLYGAEDF
jgi:hypothetical protein